MHAQAEDAALQLAQAVARRICHDLAGPLGTMGAALECLNDDPEAPALAQETATTLALRLRLLRGAWGGGVEALDAAAITTLAGGLPGIERLHLNCSAVATPLEGTAARLILCLLLVGAASLPRGGTLHAGGTDAAIWVELDAPAATWPETLSMPRAAALQQAAHPRALPAALCRLLAEEAGWAISVTGPRVLAALR